MSFAENLRELRKSRKMTQEMLAKTAGISCASIINYENGRRKNPPISIAEKLATALGVTVQALYGTVYVHEVNGETFVNGEKVDTSRIPDQHKIMLDNSYSRLSENGKKNIVHITGYMESLNDEAQEIAVKLIESLTHISSFQRDENR